MSKFPVPHSRCKLRNSKKVRDGWKSSTTLLIAGREKSRDVADKDSVNDLIERRRRQQRQLRGLRQRSRMRAMRRPRREWPMAWQRRCRLVRHQCRWQLGREQQCRLGELVQLVRRCRLGRERCRRGELAPRGRPERPVQRCRLAQPGQPGQLGRGSQPGRGSQLARPG